MKRRIGWPQTKTIHVGIKRKVGGQPLDPTGAPTEKILVPMTKDFLGRLDEAVARAGVKRTEWIRGACDQRLKREGKG